MPDLLSHILFGLIVCELVNCRKKSLFLIGAVLPDIITKIFMFGFIFDLPLGFQKALIIFHAFFPMLFAVLIIGLLFRRYITSVFFIGVGALSHILLDCLNAHYDAGIRLFFPFSWNFFRINVYWPDEYFIILIPLLAIYIVIKVFKNLSNR